MWQSDCIQPGISQPAYKRPGFVPRAERATRPLPALLRQSGAGQSSVRLLSGTFLLRIRFEFPVTVELARRTLVRWETTTYTTQNCDQLVRFSGEQVRLTVTGEAAGTAEIVRAG